MVLSGNCVTGGLPVATLTTNQKYILIYDLFPTLLTKQDAKMCKILILSASFLSLDSAESYLHLAYLVGPYGIVTRGQ